MLTLLLSISLIISILIISLKHPLSMGLTLLTQTIIVSLIIGFFRFNYWFSYILFLVIIGGILVLFIYITRVASNEIFKYSYKLLFIILTLISIILTRYLFIDPFIIYINNINIESHEYTINPIINISINKYLNYPTNLIIYIIIIYLLITLIAVVKITNIKQGPLRQTSR